MRVVVEASAGPRTGGRWLMRPGERLTFGRTEKSDIMISEDSLMSSSHFRVSVDQTSCIVEDLTSTNGTWMGEQKIAQANLVDGDQVIAGKSTFLFQIDSRDAYERTTADAQKKLNESRRLKEENREIESPENFKTGNTDVDQNRLETRDIESDFLSSPAIKSASDNKRKADQPGPSRFPMSDKAQVAPSDSPRIVASSSISSQKIAMEAKQLANGLWAIQQKGMEVAPAVIVNQLIQTTSAAFIIDRNRTGLTLRPEDENSPSYLMANLPPSAAEIVSPRLVQPIDADEFEAWMTEGWGHDGMIAVFSLVETGPMLEHFQSMMNSSAQDSDGSRGMIGLCWPSVLESSLANGKAAFATKVIEPIEAVLLDSSDAPGGWTLLGDQRLLEMLAKCEIPFSIFDPNQVADEPSGS